MRALNETQKKDFGYLLAAVSASVAIYTGLHSFVYPRTEANSSIEALNKRVDAVESNQKETNQSLSNDIRDIKRDVNGIYKILIGNKSN